MLTYQDSLTIDDTDEARLEFARSVISDHKSSELYREAVVAGEYDRRRNRTIIEYQKLLYTVEGNAVPDNWSANFKMGRAFFPIFVKQEVQFLLGNGVTWEDDSTEEALGTPDKEFDTQLQEAGHKALVGGISFGFWNLDHIEVFGVEEFAPLWDEETGALRAGVRFWQIDDTKPLRATFYEEDGYTDMIWRRRPKDGATEAEILTQKTPYKLHVTVTEADGIQIRDGENYPGFPIVPLYGNKARPAQSELVGLREQIDCYDLIKSGFANTVDEASYMYWAIQNAGGMDDIDLKKFVERMRTVHAAVVEDAGAKAEAHTVDAPYQSREALLLRLEKDLYKDAMAFDPEFIASGAVTATQIEAAYEPLNEKTDDFEYCVVKFINGILALAGIDDNPSFTRSKIVNVSEEIQTILQASASLTPDYVTEKILTLLGDGDLADEMSEEMNAEELEMGGMLEEEEFEEDEGLDGIVSSLTSLVEGL